MRDKFIRFMQGRYGVDQFSRFTIGVAFVAIVPTMFTGTRTGIGVFLDTLGMLVLVYTYFRIFSKNIEKRYDENQKYLAATSKLRERFQKEKKREWQASEKTLSIV